MGSNKTPKVIAFLDRGLEHIKSVSYKVPLRWVFYRVWQEGLLQNCWNQGWKVDKKTKKLIQFEENHAKYKLRCNINFIRATATAKRQEFRGWRRDSTIDDTRNIVWRGIGFFSEQEWLDQLTCKLDKFQNQDYFVMIMFEAQAMKPQFEHFTKHIPLIPSRGEFTLDYKNSIALGIEEVYKRYNKPVKILYFGDCDDKGRKIRKSAMRDIHEWCNVEFEDFYCGLTPEQAKEFNLEDDPEYTGSYQWEALSDEQAKKIILPFVEKYQKKNKIKEIEKKEQSILKEFKGKIKSKTFRIKKSF